MIELLLWSIPACSLLIVVTLIVLAVRDWRRETRARVGIPKAAGLKSRRVG